MLAVPLEELAAEESRALREASDWRERSKKVETTINEARVELEEATKRANAKEVPTYELAKLRQTFEMLGAARARSGSWL